MDGEGKVRRCIREGKGEICEGSEVDGEGKVKRCRRKVKEIYAQEVK